MTFVSNIQPFSKWKVLRWKYVGMFFLFLCLGGCSLWNSYLDPDYGSTRATLVCHPYGQCSQGIWVADEEVHLDSVAAKIQCQDEVDQQHGSWWDDSVSKGLEIGRCMEKRGFRLQQ